MMTGTSWFGAWLAVASVVVLVVKWIVQWINRRRGEYRYCTECDMTTLHRMSNRQWVEHLALHDRLRRLAGEFQTERPPKHPG